MFYYVALLNYNCDGFFHLKFFKADRELNFPAIEKHRNRSKSGKKRTKNFSFKTEQKMNCIWFMTKLYKREAY